MLDVVFRSVQAFRSNQTDFSGSGIETEEGGGSLGTVSNSVNL